MLLQLVFFCLVVADKAAPFTIDDIDDRVSEIIKAKRRCGPVAVWYCLKRHGYTVSGDEVVSRSPTNEQGTSLQELLDLCRSYGLTAEGIRGDPRNFAALPVPSILVIGSFHCVVYEGVDWGKRQVLFFEPTAGKHKTASLEELQHFWTGEALVFRHPQTSSTSVVALAALIASSILLAGITISKLARLTA
jgi:ABC-type bacteriocin/lantibiotic exporter with double-glycine peptidase domain